MLFVKALVVLRNGNLASGSKNPEGIKIWNPNAGTLIRTLASSVNPPVFDLIELDNGQLANSSPEINEVRIWNPDDVSDSSSSLIGIISTPSPCQYMTALRNSQFVCSMWNGLCLMNAVSLTIVSSVILDDDGETPLGLATLNNGTHFAYCTNPSSHVVVWEVASNDQLTMQHTINNTDCNQLLTALKDGNLATGTKNNLIRIFRTNAGL